MCVHVCACVMCVYVYAHDCVSACVCVYAYVICVCVHVCIYIVHNDVCMCCVCMCEVPPLPSQGAGCALMERQTRFESIVKGMVDVIDCPLTVKMRTGVRNKHWNAHKLLPKLRDWGVAMATVRELTEKFNLANCIYMYMYVLV